MLLYRQHLQRQYKDRICYWSLRSQSRLTARSDGANVLTLCVDSIDHMKFPYPKSQILEGKEFANFLRPTLQCTCILAHGRGVFLYLSDVHVSHDSSWSADIIANCLHEIATHDASLDFRRVVLAICGDNSSKELKNNACVRVLAGLTACHRIACGKLATLESGHSHEDIDQFFSSLATECGRLQTINSPRDYVTQLQKWLDSSGIRPLEKIKQVKLVDRVRSWMLAPMVFSCFFFEFLSTLQRIVTILHNVLHFDIILYSIWDIKRPKQLKHSQKK